MYVVIICDTNANYLVRVCLILAQYENNPTHNVHVPNALISQVNALDDIKQTPDQRALAEHPRFPLRSNTSLLHELLPPLSKHQTDCICLL